MSDASYSGQESGEKQRFIKARPMDEQKNPKTGPKAGKNQLHVHVVCLYSEYFALLDAFLI